jgi:hypothetical protein
VVSEPIPRTSPLITDNLSTSASGIGHAAEVLRHPLRAVRLVSAFVREFPLQSRFSRAIRPFVGLTSSRKLQPVSGHFARSRVEVKSHEGI